MKITVDQQKCCGSGQCVMIAPDIFDQRDEDGIVILSNARPDTGQHRSVRESAEMCPTAAIHLDENG